MEVGSSESAAPEGKKGGATATACPTNGHLLSCPPLLLFLLRQFCGRSRGS